jgi:hypothetical protein
MNILRRTIFKEVTNSGGTDYHRYFDWAVLATDLGPMFQPFTPNMRRWAGTNTPDFVPWDYEDVDQMVNDVVTIDVNKAMTTVFAGLHGGVMSPRAGR